VSSIHEILKNILELQKLDSQALAMQGGVVTSIRSKCKGQGTENPQQSEEISVNIREIESLKLQAISHIPVKFVVLYLRLSKVKDGVAVARLHGNSCGECHMTLPIHFVNQLSSLTKIEQCPACHRILVPARLMEGH